MIKLTKGQKERDRIRALTMNPVCFVCQEELRPSANATIVIQGPNVGKFIHLKHPRTEGDIYAGEHAAGVCQFPGGKR